LNGKELNFKYSSLRAGGAEGHRLGERISEFMKRIGRGDRVFVVLSDNYCKSYYCMSELSDSLKQGTRARYTVNGSSGSCIFENILIGRSDCCLPGCKIALELCEHLDLASDMKIGVPLRAADKIIVIVIGADADVRRVVGLEALPQATQGDHETL
jgi:hypothetical protein